MIGTGVRISEALALTWADIDLDHGVHTNATFTDPGPAATRLRKPASHLHIPTGRVPLEFVLWHLIAEWGVTPKTDAWRELLVDSLEGFERRRRAP